MTIQKYPIRDALIEHLYGPSKKRLQKRLHAILESHAIDDRHGAMAFLYKGQVYSHPNHRSGYPCSLLTRRLYDIMDEWKLENEKTESEELEMISFFTCLLNECSTMSQIKDLLPDCLKPAIQPTIQPGGFKPEYIEQFQKKHSAFISKIKQRMLLNLIE